MMAHHRELVQTLDALHTLHQQHMAMAGKPSAASSRREMDLIMRARAVVKGMGKGMGMSALTGKGSR
jgi:hypothetical protein